MSKKNTVILAVIVLINISLSYMVLVLDMHFLYVENGWMENIQAGILLLACIIFAISSVQGRNTKRRILTAFFSVLCFIFAFREVDVDTFDVPVWMIFLLAEKGRAVFFITAIFLLALVLKDSMYYFKNWRVCFSSLLAIYVMIAAFLLIFLSSAFDQEVFDIPYSTFYEEVSELLAYCLLLAASLDLVQALNPASPKPKKAQGL